MMKTKSLFMNVATPLAILICGIVIGRFLLSTKPETPKNTKYKYGGEVRTQVPLLEPLKHRISNYKNINKVGAVPDAATAYEISKALLIATYGKDKIDYSEPFKIQLEDSYVWSIEAIPYNQPFWFYNIDIDKRDGCIIDFRLAK